MAADRCFLCEKDIPEFEPYRNIVNKCYCENCYETRQAEIEEFRKQDYAKLKEEEDEMYRRADEEGATKELPGDWLSENLGNPDPSPEVVEIDPSPEEALVEIAPEYKVSTTEPVKFVRISTCATQHFHHLLGLDNNGCVWEFSFDRSKWKKLPVPQEG